MMILIFCVLRIISFSELKTELSELISFNTFYDISAVIAIAVNTLFYLLEERLIKVRAR
jgi:hypothetical protein